MKFIDPINPKGAPIRGKRQKPSECNVKIYVGKSKNRAQMTITFYNYIAEHISKTGRIAIATEDNRIYFAEPFGALKGFKICQTKNPENSVINTSQVIDDSEGFYVLEHSKDKNMFYIERT